jgi:hypothetical protein
VEQSRGHLLLVWVLEQPISSLVPNIQDYKERLVALLLSACHPNPHDSTDLVHAPQHTYSVA